MGLKYEPSSEPQTGNVELVKAAHLELKWLAHLREQDLSERSEVPL